MYCFLLSILEDILTQKQIEQLNDYFSGLNGGAVNNITVSKVSKAMNIQSSLASKILTKCKQEDLLKTYYAIRCPECGTLIKKVFSLQDVPQGDFECYSCNETIKITPRDVEILYSLVDSSVFKEGQRVENEFDSSARPVALEDSMESVFTAGGINEYLFHPTDEEYSELKRMYESINSKNGTTKAIGDTLEGLTKYLFNLCPVFRAAGIRTSTNQIDCCVRNRAFLNFGILKSIGGRFFIECKNEGKTPKGDYLSKLHSIICNSNAGAKGDFLKLGIIISKRKGPRTFKDLAIKSYLADGIVLISICGEEIKELVDNKGNLLEMIERKISEIIFDSTSDLVSEGLFDI